MFATARRCAIKAGVEALEHSCPWVNAAAPPVHRARGDRHPRLLQEMQPHLPQDVMMAEEHPHVDWEAMGATTKSNNGQSKVKGQVKGQVMKGKVKGQEQPMKGKGQEQPMKRKKLNSQ